MSKPVLAEFAGEREESWDEVTCCLRIRRGPSLAQAVAPTGASVDGGVLSPLEPARSADKMIVVRDAHRLTGVAPGDLIPQQPGVLWPPHPGVPRTTEQPPYGHHVPVYLEDVFA